MKDEVYEKKAGRLANILIGIIMTGVIIAGVVYLFVGRKFGLLVLCGNMFLIMGGMYVGIKMYELDIDKEKKCDTYIIKEKDKINVSNIKG